MSKKSRYQNSSRRKRRIENRLRQLECPDDDKPVFTASNIHYDVSNRTDGFGHGGIGAIHLMVTQIELAKAIDENVHLLKIHLPYHESDHVLNMTYNILCGGSCLEDLELLRNDEVYLDALGVQRIPDPTTAGDFCRRFDESDVEALMTAINQTRLKVWQTQDDSFFNQAIIEADGTLAPTLGECKEGMDISYKGTWGYHPLIVSLANTAEPLYLVNRSGNRPSHEGATERFDQAMDLCREAGFRSILLRGDTDFTQTKSLDEWDAAGDVRFVFGINSCKQLRQIAADLPDTQWKSLNRPASYEVQTEARQRPENVKDEIVFAREYKNLRLDSEQVAEFTYTPTQCQKPYRVVVCRKNISVEKGEQLLFDEIRDYFYITNDLASSKEQIVYSANARCNQENLIEQLKDGAKALRMPVDGLVSNWAYMVITSLAWTLKAWFGLLLPVQGRWSAKHEAEKREVQRMEFKRFVNAFIRVPCQIVRGARRIAFRLLSWNPWQAVLLRAVDALRRPLRC